MTFKTFFKKLVKQNNTTPKIGAVMNAYSSTAVLYSPLTLIGVVTTIYGLWGRSFLAQYIPWLTFPVLLCIMVGIILFAMIFFYKFIIPSQVAFAMQQNYRHQNPLVKDMKICLLQQKIISIRLANIENKTSEDIGKIEEIEKQIKDLEKEREVWEKSV